MMPPMVEEVDGGGLGEGEEEGAGEGCPPLLLLLLLCCILLLLVDLSQVMWGPSRHLGSFTAANWVSFDFDDSYSSC